MSVENLLFQNHVIALGQKISNPEVIVDYIWVHIFRLEENIFDMFW